MSERLRKHEDDSTSNSGVVNALNYYKDLLTQEKEKVASLSVQAESLEKVKVKLLRDNEEMTQKARL
jgi:hypothetical protein